MVGRILSFLQSGVEMRLTLGTIRGQISTSSVFFQRPLASLACSVSQCHLLLPLLPPKLRYFLYGRGTVCLFLVCRCPFACGWRIAQMVLCVACSVSRDILKEMDFIGKYVEQIQFI